jgi:hypothetical protein
MIMRAESAETERKNVSLDCESSESKIRTLTRKEEGLDSGTEDLRARYGESQYTGTRGDLGEGGGTYGGREASQSGNRGVTGVSGEALTTVDDRASNTSSEITSVVKGDRVDSAKGNKLVDAQIRPKPIEGPKLTRRPIRSLRIPFR